MHDIFRLLQRENALLSLHTIMKLTALSGGIVFGPCFSVLSSLSICFKKDNHHTFSFCSRQNNTFLYNAECYFTVLILSIAFKIVV